MKRGRKDVTVDGPDEPLVDLLAEYQAANPVQSAAETCPSAEPATGRLRLVRSWLARARRAVVGLIGWWRALGWRARLGGHLTLAMAITLAAVGLLVAKERVRTESAITNRALVDTEATTKVVGDVSNALTKIFSYSPSDIAATERAADEALAGPAEGQYRQLFAQVRQQAPVQNLAVRTRVVRAGVSRLSGDTAHLLVFIDQTATRDGKRAGGTAAAQLSVTARLHDGQWRIVEIHAN